ncbi:MAG: beta-lactamase family protein [Lachnospiraceae bacterium]|nr:beta-lactamase family protein [Lachnospiraceae bacterium]
MKNKGMRKVMISMAVCTLLSATYGGKIVNAKSPASEDGYVYCVASVSKVYVTAAVMRLADEGRLDIDAPVTYYIPDFAMADERYKQITVRMLMNHTSGIMGSTQPGMFQYNDNDPVHYDSLLPVLSGQRLKADPGEYAAYCNDGFDLLERIVENVSGMSYSDYVAKYLAEPTKGTNTGTGLSFCDREDLVPAYLPDHRHYENGITMALGAGGIFSTAKDVVNFGSAFFKGETSLLSESAKEKMSTRWDGGKDPYADECGLGWDMVSLPKYDKANVKVLGKGGDAELNHAFLMVAPDEQISISVLSNGGSSTYNGIVAQALLDVALKEQGITVSDEDGPEYQTAGEIPEEYDAFAGMYSSQDGAGGAAVINISFPDHKYVHTEQIGLTKTTVTDYVYTTEGTFAELAFPYEDGGKIAGNPTVISFQKNNGHLYFTAQTASVAPGLGKQDRKMYAGEKMEENPVSKEVMQAWKNISDQDFLLCNEIASSVAYDRSIGRIYENDALPGYLFLFTNWGTRLVKIADETHAYAFSTIPSSANRDLLDVTIEQEENGRYMNLSTGLSYVLAADLPVLTQKEKEIDLKRGQARWYRIDETMANQPLMLEERPEESAVYVYNKYGEVVYTTHDLDATSDLPMPSGGYIVFLGETGEKVTLR